MFSLTMLIVFVFALAAIQWWQNRNKRKLYNDLNLGYTNWPFIGNANYFAGNQEKLMEKLKLMGKNTIKNGGSSCFWHFNTLLFVTCHAADAEFLVTNVLNKGDIAAVLRCVGENLLNSRVHVWRTSRKVVSSVFTMKRLQEATMIQLKNARTLADKLKSAVGVKSKVWDYLAAYATANASETLFGMKSDAQENNGNEFMENLFTNLKICGLQIMQPWNRFELLSPFFSAQNIALKTSEFLMAFTKKHYEDQCKNIRNRPTGEKSASPHSSDSILEKLISLHNEGKGLSESALCSEVLGLLVAAVDTSTSSMTCTLWLLASYPEIQEKVFDELKKYYGHSDEPVRREDLSHFKYLELVIKESQRLFPPVPIIPRKTTQPLILPSGVKLMPDVEIFVDVRTLHRNPMYWGSDAEQFKPERFLGKVDRSAYMPFGKGPRSCLGQHVANSTIKSALATILRRYRFTLTPGTEKTLRLEFAITAKPVDLYCLQVELRP